MSIYTKICGINDIESGLLCSSLGADALGFIRYEKSPRFVELDVPLKIQENFCLLYTSDAAANLCV